MGFDLIEDLFKHRANRCSFGFLAFSECFHNTDRDFLFCDESSGSSTILWEFLIQFSSFSSFQQSRIDMYLRIRRMGLSRLSRTHFIDGTVDQTIVGDGMVSNSEMKTNIETDAYRQTNPYLSAIASIKTGRISVIANSRVTFVALQTPNRSSPYHHLGNEPR